MKRVRTLALLALLSASALSPITVLAEESTVVAPEEFSLKTAQGSDGLFSSVQEENGRLIIARSLATSDAFVDAPSPKEVPAYAPLSEEAKSTVSPTWALDPMVGGSAVDGNVILVTPETKKALSAVYTHLVDDMRKYPDLHLDVQAVPVFEASEDVVPTYLFVGFRAVDADGRPIDLTLWTEDIPQVGYVFEGGSGYFYTAISNSSTQYALDYGSGEPSRKPKNEGFSQSFDPAVYFGTPGAPINNETTAAITKDNLPPGSSEVFLQTGAGEQNALQQGVAQANGENTGLFNGKMMAVLVPFLLMGAVLLIAMGN